jgi:carbonic anhydrase
VEYAVEVLRVSSITVCGHSGCGAMQALLKGAHEPVGVTTSLGRWLRNGGASLARLRRDPTDFAERPGDELERLCLSNVVQQLENLASHAAVRARVADGSLHLAGMYFDLATAQAYLLDRASGSFVPVADHDGGPEDDHYDQKNDQDNGRHGKGSDRLNDHGNDFGDDFGDDFGKEEGNGAETAA